MRLGIQKFDESGLKKLVFSVYQREENFNGTLEKSGKSEYYL